MSDSIESGMKFVQEEGCYFKIEACPTMRVIGVKTCDFLILKTTRAWAKLFIVEAKSSAPKPPDKPDVQKQSWEEFLQVICEKTLNSLLVFIGLKVGRKYSKPCELPLHIAQLRLNDVSITPCLVLKDHPKQALPPVSNALKIKMQPIVKSFVLNDPLVINHETAMRYGLVEDMDG